MSIVTDQLLGFVMSDYCPILYKSDKLLRITFFVEIEVKAILLVTNLNQLLMSLVLQNQLLKIC